MILLPTIYPHKNLSTWLLQRLRHNMSPAFEPLAANVIILKNQFNPFSKLFLSSKLKWESRPRCQTNINWDNYAKNKINLSFHSFNRKLKDYNPAKRTTNRFWCKNKQSLSNWKISANSFEMIMHNWNNNSPKKLSRLNN